MQVDTAPPSEFGYHTMFMKPCDHMNRYGVQCTNITAPGYAYCSTHLCRNPGCEEETTHGYCRECREYKCVNGHMRFPHEMKERPFPPGSTEPERVYSYNAQYRPQNRECYENHRHYYFGFWQ